MAQTMAGSSFRDAPLRDSCGDEIAVPVFAALNIEWGLCRLRVINRVALSTCFFLTGTIGVQRAGAVGDTRTLSLHHVHTNEDLTVTFKKNGQYDEEALKKINWIMRDWRKNEATKMDPQEIDLLWEVYQEVGAKEPIHIICGFRAPATNEMLRHRSRRSGVARNSQHTLGKAIDFYIPGVSLDTLRATAMRLQGGGVGYYPTSGSPFVHLDVGNVRAWPRMTREQLAKLFPDGRTVHLPADGDPLPGYQLALADLENGHRGTAASQPKKKSLLAAMFGLDKDADETDDNATSRESPAPRSASAKSAPAPAPAPAARIQVASAAAPAAESVPVQAAAALAVLAQVPLPPKRPALQVAAAESRPAPAAAPAAAPVVLASLSPSQIIGARGLWDSVTGVPKAIAASEPNGLDISSARRKLVASMTAAGGTDTTASVGPFPRQDPLPGSVLAYADAGGPQFQGKRSSSVAAKVVDTATSRPSAERLNDPWMRGLMLATSMQNSLVVTTIGDPDYTGLVTFMRKPSSAVMMSFSDDPHAGITADQFAGSAVVFPPTVSFGPTRRRTANLQ
jgi:uncharacterized protein YcbK (DUF882 family)